MGQALADAEVHHHRDRPLACGHGRGCAGHCAEKCRDQDDERESAHGCRQPPTTLSVNSACSLESTSGFG